MKRLLCSCATALLLLVPVAAFAVPGYTVATVNMLAGPDTQYPLIYSLDAGTPVDVQGCTEGWQWCDVIAGGSRGWIAGPYIEYLYNNQPVIVTDYGARIGIPIVTFAIGTYWGRYYVNRPFYRDRARWYSRPVPVRPFPGPRPPVRPWPGNRPPGGRPPSPGNGYRPQPPGGNRPQPGNGNRPQPGGDNRPPGGGNNRPQPGGDNQRPPGGNRPQPGNGNGGRPGQNTKPAPRPNPQQQQQGNNGNGGG
ncbi:SH3 domain-containing protein [Dyella humi]|uniref:SH3 domain-containing protein n=1 Tax=Dyella humi TaxID=1770547 RepID=A0ABW8IJH9_9GAMM